MTQKAGKIQTTDHSDKWKAYSNVLLSILKSTLETKFSNNLYHDYARQRLCNFIAYFKMFSDFKTKTTATFCSLQWGGGRFLWATI